MERARQGLHRAPVYGGAVLSDRREKGRRARSYRFSEGKRKRRRPGFRGRRGSRAARGGRGARARRESARFRTRPTREDGRVPVAGRGRAGSVRGEGEEPAVEDRRVPQSGHSAGVPEAQAAARARARAVDAVLTPGGERDALALEARLIQRIKPPLNVLLKHAPRPDAARIVATLDDPVAPRFFVVDARGSRRRVARAEKEKRAFAPGRSGARPDGGGGPSPSGGGGGGGSRLAFDGIGGRVSSGTVAAARSAFEAARGSDADGVDGVAVFETVSETRLPRTRFWLRPSRADARRALRPRARAGPARARVPRQARRRRGARAAERKREPRRRRAGRRRRRGSRGGPLRRARRRRRRRRDPRGGGAGRVGARRALRSAAGGGAGGGERR